MSYSQRIDTLAKCFLITAGFFIPISTALMNIFIYGACFFFLCSGQWTDKFNFVRKEPALYISLFFYLVVLCGLAYGPALFQERIKELGGYSFLLALPALGWLFREEKWRRLGIYTFVAAMLLILFASYLKFYFHPHFLIAHRAGPDTGPEIIFRDHISIGILFAFLMGLLVYFYVNATFALRCLFGILLLLLSWYMLFMNEGRTTYVIFFALIVLLGWQLKGWKTLFIACGISLGLLLTVLHYNPQFNAKSVDAMEDYQSYSQGQSANGTVSLRLVAMKSGFVLFKQHPFLGVGTGSFYPAAVKDSGFPVNTLSVNTYNDTSYIAAQWGVVGLIAFLILYGVQLVRSRQLPYYYNQLTQLLLVIFIIGGLSNCMLHDAVEKTFYLYFIALLFAASKTSATSTPHPIPS
jgi:O-antigen ligase